MWRKNCQNQEENGKIHNYSWRRQCSSQNKWQNSTAIGRLNIIQQNLTDINRTLYPTTAKSTLLSKQMPRQIIFWALKQTSTTEICDIIRNIFVKYFCPHYSHKAPKILTISWELFCFVLSFVAHGVYANEGLGKGVLDSLRMGMVTRKRGRSLSATAPTSGKEKGLGELEIKFHKNSWTISHELLGW